MNFTSLRQSVSLRFLYEGCVLSGAARVSGIRLMEIVPENSDGGGSDFFTADQRCLSGLCMDDERLRLNPVR